MADFRQEMIAYPSGDHETPAFVARPDDHEAHPGLVVLQEWWGLVPHIKDVATRFAREGYIALAPDLYYGSHAEEPDEARKLAMALDRDRAVAEIREAVKYLREDVRVQPPVVGFVGWCMGGGLALSTATGPGIGAVVAFYGRPLQAEDIAAIQAPVLGLYGREDHGIPLAAVREFDEALAENGIQHEIVVYPDAGHAFFNDTRASYVRDAAEDAWRRTLAWFGEHLQQSEDRP
jgi:carboxymethylenebutenolidase